MFLGRRHHSTTIFPTKRNKATFLPNVLCDYSQGGLPQSRSRDNNRSNQSPKQQQFHTHRRLQRTQLDACRCLHSRIRHQPDRLRLGPDGVLSLCRGRSDRLSRASLPDATRRLRRLSSKPVSGGLSSHLQRMLPVVRNSAPPDIPFPSVHNGQDTCVRAC